MKKLFLFTLLILLVAFLPFLLLRGNLWFSSDFLYQEIPFILETKRMLATGTPWWSWNTYLGADFIGSYAFYTLTSPFVWINCLFPSTWVAYSTALTLVLKFLCLGWVTLVYLRKMGVSRENSWFGALLFSFSSFSIGSLYYYHFYEPIIAFVLMLIAVERFLRGQEWGATCLAIATFVVVFINFYFAIGSLIAIFIYVIFRAFAIKVEFNWRTATRGMAAVIVGVLMSAFFLLPVFNQMLLSTRAEAQSAVSPIAMLNLLERFRTLFMPKMIEGVTPFVNPGSGPFSNEACIAIFGLSLTCVYIARRRDWLASLAGVLLIFYLTPLNGVFTLFTNPLYTRWAYALTLVIVLCTVRVLDDGRTVKKPMLYYSIVATLIVIAFIAKVMVEIGGIFIGVRTMLQIALFFAGLIVLLLWSCDKMSVRWLRVATMVAMVVQVWLYLLNIGFDQSYKNLISNVENGGATVNSRVDFRQACGYWANNAGLLRNHASVLGYHSVISAPMHDFYSIATRDFWSTNKLRANINQDEFDALLSVKNIYYVDSALNVTKRSFKHFIPMGFAYDSYITRSEFNKLMGDTTRNLPLLMLAHMVVEDDDAQFMSKWLAHGTVNDSLNLDSLALARKHFVATHFKGTSTGYTAQVDLPASQVLFFSVPFSKGFTATIDGCPVSIHKANLCMQALAIPAGKHSITVEYMPPGLKQGCGLSLLGLLLLMLIMWSDKKTSRTAVLISRP